jgi:hypothetical protein
VTCGLGSRVPSSAVVTVVSAVQVVAPLGRRSTVTVSPAIPALSACWSRPVRVTVPPYRTLVGAATRVRVVAAGGAGVTGAEGVEGGLVPSALVAATEKV